MNKQQVEALAQIWLTAAVATVGVFGWMKGVDLAPLISFGVAIIVSVFGVRTSSTNSLVAKVADAPQVKAVVMNSEAAAEATPSLAKRENVVGPNPTPSELKKL